jgi:adenylate cyclase
MVEDVIKDRKGTVSTRLSFAGMVFDFDERNLVDASGADVPLTPSEFGLLATFLRHPARAMSRDQLLQAVAGRGADAFDRSVDVLVGRLRRKVEPDPKNPRLIVTVPGVGYKFATHPTPIEAAVVPSAIRAAEPDWPSLAVLPFDNLSGDSEQDYFADGVVEEITTALSRVRWFFVIACNSSFTYKGRAVDVRQVGRELGVRYVLRGSVRRASERVRITAHLVETEAGVQVWADRFEGVIESIFDLQDEITARVVGAIEPRLRDAEITRATRQRPRSLTAYDCFLRGMAKYACESRDENDAMMRLLRSAIASDPTFAPPYGLAAMGCSQRVGQGWSENARQDRAFGIAMAHSAVRLGAEDPTTLALAALALGYFTDDYDLAVSLSEQALALNPSSATALQCGGWVRLYAGEPAPAMSYLMRGARLNPIDTRRFILDSGLAYACVMLGRYEEAVGWALKSLGSSAQWSFGQIPLAGALAMLGRTDEARAAVSRLLARIPRYTVTRELRLYKSGSARDALAAALATAGFPP